jgi:hypothetical protein
VRLLPEQREFESVREQVWLAALQAGHESTATLAVKCKLSQRQIRRRIARARAFGALDGEIPYIELIMGPNPKQCGHDRPIPIGEAIICLDCMLGGLDHWREFQRSSQRPRDPEGKGTAYTGPPLTRPRRAAR